LKGLLENVPSMIKCG